MSFLLLFSSLHPSLLPSLPPSLPPPTFSVPSSTCKRAACRLPRLGACAFGPCPEGREGGREGGRGGEKEDEWVGIIEDGKERDWEGVNKVDGKEGEMIRTNERGREGGREKGRRNTYHDVLLDLHPLQDLLHRVAPLQSFSQFFVGSFSLFPHFLELRDRGHALDGGGGLREGGREGGREEGLPRTRRRRCACWRAGRSGSALAQ